MTDAEYLRLVRRQLLDRATEALTLHRWVVAERLLAAASALIDAHDSTDRNNRSPRGWTW